MLSNRYKFYKDPGRQEGKWRFFYHYNKKARCMTVHFANACHLAPSGLKCYVPAESKVNKRQPYIVMQGWASEVRIKNGVAHIL